MKSILRSSLIKPKILPQIRLRTLNTDQYIKEIIKSPDNIDNYYNLLRSTKYKNDVFDIGGQNMNPQDMLLKIIALDPNNCLAYSKLASTMSEGKGLVLPNGETWNRWQVMLKAIELKSRTSYPYTAVADLMESASVQIDGKDWTKRDLYLKALEFSPNYSRAKIGLAKTMQTNEEEIEVDGKSYNRIGLVKTAINNTPKDWRGYFALTKFYKDDDIIELENGEKFTKKQLLVKSYSYKESSAIVLQIEKLMNNTEKITINNEEFTRPELLFNAIKDGVPLKYKTKLFYALVKNVPKEGYLIKGKQYTKEYLLQLWQKHTPRISDPYKEIVKEYTPEDNFTFLDGTTMSYRDICLKALELKKNDWIIYYYLSKTLKDKDEKVVVKRKTFTKKSLLKHFIHNVRLHPDALSDYANLMEDDETLILRGKIFTKQNLPQSFAKTNDLS